MVKPTLQSRVVKHFKISESISISGASFTSKIIAFLLSDLLSLFLILEFFFFSFIFRTVKTTKPGRIGITRIAEHI